MLSILILLGFHKVLIFYYTFDIIYNRKKKGGKKEPMKKRVKKKIENRKLIVTLPFYIYGQGK